MRISDWSSDVCSSDLAERIRAGGAGIPAFYTKTGVGTVVAEGKPVEEFEGALYVRETWLRADLSIVKAWKADPEGNLVYRKTARNFNPNMATAGKITIVEVEELVPSGALDPDQFHTPGIYVDSIIQGPAYDNKIEVRTTRPREDASALWAGHANRWRPRPLASCRTAFM